MVQQRMTQSLSGLKIREARSDADYHTAYPLILQLFPHLDMQTYAHRVFVARATGYRMFVGQVEDDVVGVIGIISNHNIHDGFVTYIEHVVVGEAHRGMGYGSQLIRFAEERALEEGCKLIELDTDLGNDKARKLYEKSGYKQSGHYLYKELDKDGDTSRIKE
jgi:GNAT superfamily N-acetyltransferase